MLEIKAVNVDITKDLEDLGQNIQVTKRGIRQGLYRLGLKLKQYARDRIITRRPVPSRPVKGQRIYRRENGKLYRASEPGEYPARRDGGLKKSLNFSVNATQMQFGSTVEYAPFLEEGTGRIKARPFIIPTVQDNRRDALIVLREEIKKAIRQENLH